MTLRIPPAGALDELRVETVLRAAGFPVPPLRPGWAAPVLAAVQGVRGLPHEPVPTFAVGGERVRNRVPGAPAPATLVCSCGGRSCVHVAAVLVVAAFQAPASRVALEGPAWELALAPLSAPAPPPRPEGRLRVCLPPPAPGAPGLLPDLRRVEVGPDGREISSRAAGATAGGGAVAEAVRALEQARRLRAPGLVRYLARRLVEALADVDDVRVGEVAVRVTSVPVRPLLRAEGAPGGGLTLGFVPAVRHHWPEGDVVLTADGVLAPLADDVPPELAAAAHRPLPPVPPDEVGRFVERIVVDRGLPVLLPDWLDPVEAPEERFGAVALSEEGDTLRIDLSLVLGRAGLRAVVDPDRPAPTARIPGGGLVRRDPEWERAEVARFSREVGVRRLRGEAAYDWLSGVLPALLGRWRVEGDDRLVRHRVRGALTPRVRFSEGVDWFDLDVDFGLGEVTVDGAEGARRWLAGERWVRLDDGSVASLPGAWLSRHARAIDTLAEVRRAQRGLGGWHAWEASELLAEVGAPAARWLDRVAAADHVSRREVPAGLRADLRPYQRQGLDWLCFLAEQGLHGLLADEMGLGKTVQALAWLLATPRSAPALVVTPTSVSRAWLDEAARFAPGLRTALRRPAPGVDLVVTSWAMLRRDVEHLAAVDWSAVVLDEAQALKNPASQTARAARRLRARHRLALTGTPVENDLLELWSIFHFLMPGFLGTRRAFHARYHATARDGRAGGTAELQARIRPFVLRRRKVEVARDLPERIDRVLTVTLGPRERALYELVHSTVRATALAPDDDRTAHRTAVLLEGLLRLRQACCHPALVPLPEARGVNRSAKVEALLEELSVALPAGERVLVFSQWTRLLDEVGTALDGAGWRWLRLDGSTADRAGVVAAFQRGDAPVMLVSVKAGGTGLTLTAADRVVLLDPWWNPAVEEQAAARAHRIGRERPVTVVRLIAADTVEERILELQAAKRRLAAETVEGPALDVSALGVDDLRRLLT